MVIKIKKYVLVILVHLVTIKNKMMILMILNFFLSQKQENKLLIRYKNKNKNKLIQKLVHCLCFKNIKIL